LHGLADENYIPFTNQPSTAHGPKHTGHALAIRVMEKC
jgi:hypothetical protein